MTINIYVAIGLIVFIFNLQTVQVNGNCMAGMSKMNPIKKAGEASYKEVCSKCELKVNQADIQNAIDNGGKTLMDTIAGYLSCKEKDELMDGMGTVFKECLGKLKEGASMCKKESFNDFSKCAEDKAKEKNLMKLGMACCNDPGFADLFKLLDCAFLNTVKALQGKKMVDKSVKEWEKAKLKCVSGVSGYEGLMDALVGYTKNC